MTTTPPLAGIPDREAVLDLNPLVGGNATQTMELCAALAFDLGHLTHATDGKPGIHAGWMLEVIAAALRWEAANLDQARVTAQSATPNAQTTH